MFEVSSNISAVRQGLNPRSRGSKAIELEGVKEKQEEIEALKKLMTLLLQILLNPKASRKWRSPITKEPSVHWSKLKSVKLFLNAHLDDLV